MPRHQGIGLWSNKGSADDMFYILSQNFAKVRKALYQFCARGEGRCFSVGFAALFNRDVSVLNGIQEVVVSKDLRDVA